MKPEDIFKQAQGNQNRIIMPGQEQQQQADPMTMIAMEIQRLGMGLAHTSRTNALIGKATDMAQLSVQLLFSLLVDKGVVEEDELKKLYQENVIDRYKAMEVEAKEYAEQQLKEQQKQETTDLKEATEQSEKATDAVVSDAEEVLDNVRHIMRKDE